MKSKIAQKQFYLYLGLIFLTALISLFTYQFTQQKWVLYRQAEKEFHKQAFQEAISLYQSSLEKGSTTSRLYVHLADSYTALGNFPEAIHFYRKYLDFYPNDNAVRLLLARALNWNGNFKESKEEYQKVLENPHEE